MKVALDAVDHGRDGGGGVVAATPSEVAPGQAVHTREVAALLAVRALPAAPVPLVAARESLLDVQSLQVLLPLSRVWLSRCWLGLSCRSGLCWHYLSTRCRRFCRCHNAIADAARSTASSFGVLNMSSRTLHSRAVSA